MARYLIVAALASGGFAVTGPIETDDPQSLIDTTADLFPSVDVDTEGDGILAIEVHGDSSFSIPTEDHGDMVTVVSLGGATMVDLAGVERTAAGRPIDAPPGSRDAANTGMQHDLGAGTVTNTTSPEPTPSLQVQEVAASLRDQPAPTEAQATHE